MVSSTMTAWPWPATKGTTSTMSPTSAHQPKKHLGQHFLHDQGVLNHIVHGLHMQPDDHWLEIGPGLGALTCHLLSHTTQLVAVEKDSDVIPTLQANIHALGPCQIINADILQVDLANIMPDRYRIVGNLPYQISTPLTFHLLKQTPHIIDMHFMLQKEVAKRMAATPGQRAFGRLSVMVQYHCDVHVCFDVPPSAFTPPPKVQSSFVQLIPHAKPHVRAENEHHFAQWVKLSFQQKRKKLRNGLSKCLTETQQTALLPWAQLRPETLSVEDFVNLSNTLGMPPGISS